MQKEEIQPDELRRYAPELLKTRWAAIALCGFCLLTAVLIHWRANEMIEVQKNVAMAGGYLMLAVFGPGPWSVDGWRGREA